MLETTEFTSPSLRLDESSTVEQERFESIKAGVLAAAATIATTIALIGVEMSLGLGHPFRWLDLVIRCTIAGLSGGLFGVTYRHIVRADPNPHLRSGAVGAFGLVRALGQMEGHRGAWGSAIGEISITGLGSLLLIFGESMLLFWVAAQGLHSAMSGDVLKPFRGLEVTDSNIPET